MRRPRQELRSMDMPVSAPRVDYRTDPGQYRHWKLSTEGALARLTLDVAEDAGIRPGYKLKLNSYDLGVDVELADALNRVRFEHPEVRSVIVTSVEGVRGQRAVEWRLVDAIAKPAQFAATVHERAERLGAASPRRAANPVALPRLERSESETAIRYEHVAIDIDRTRRTATIVV